MRELLHQTRSRTWMLAARLVTAALASGAAIIAAVVLAASVTNLGLGTYTRDLASLSLDAGVTLPPLAGAMSLLNLALWACVATSAVIVATLVRARRSWLLWFAAFAVFLAVDDGLSIHEIAGSEVAFFVVYGLGALLLAAPVLLPRTIASSGSTLGGAWSVRAFLLKAGPRGVAFLLGGILLAGSVVFDHVVPGPAVFEDGLKLLGTLVWMTVPMIALRADIAPSATPTTRVCTCSASEALTTTSP